MTDELTRLADFGNAISTVLQAHGELQARTSTQADELREQDLEIAALQARVAELEARPSTPSTAPTDLPLWKLLFHDDFSAGLLSAKWGAYPTTYRDTSKNGIYDPENMTVSDGNMVIRLYKTAGMFARVCAPVPKILGPDPLQWGMQNLRWADQLYGRYSVRMRVPAPIPGFKIAWLTWPDVGTNTTGSPSGTGGNGEIDWPECGLDQSIVTVGGFMHRQDAVVGNDQYSTGILLDLREWHTFTTEWRPNRCSFLVDGVLVGSTTDRVPNTMMHHVLQCETRLSGGAPPDGIDGVILVDSYTAWKYAP